MSKWDPPYQSRFDVIDENVVRVTTTFVPDFSDHVDTVSETVKQKNAAYGNSFGTAGDALRILYPDGIKPEQYGDMLLITRIWDKLKRLATNNDPSGESPYTDIAGYAICGLTTRKETE